jgi:hypothetical protein
VFAQILSFLSHYPNFFDTISPVWCALFAGVCLWQAALSWSIQRQTGMRSYIGATVGNLLAMAGGVFAPLVHSVLQVALLPAPLLLGGFVVLSLSDARSWFSSEAHDKFYLIRHGGLSLRLFGRVPAGFVHQASAPASWLQGVMVGSVTLAFLGFVYPTVWHGYGQEIISGPAFGWITVTCGMVAFHSLALLLCGLLFGSPVGRRRRPESAEGARDAEASE